MDIDRCALRRGFQRAAGSWDQAAVLHREIGGRLLERLQLTHQQPRVVYDVGCGSGLVTRDLARRYRKARVVVVEMAPALLMLARTRAPLLRPWSCVCAHAEQLPLAGASCDLLFSNLALHWSNDIFATLAEFARVLRPEGLLMFSTLGPDTLQELRSSWRAVDDAPHVHGFLDLHDVGDAMLRAGLRDPVTDAERLTITYANVDGLMRDLKALGATNVLSQRRSGLTGKDRLRAMSERYQTYRVEAGLPATFEIVYGHAWAPVEPAPKPAQRVPGVTTVALSALGGRGKVRGSGD